MPIFSAESLSNLAECDPQLQEVFFEVIKHIDCSIICGHRGEIAQHKAFLEGNSQLDWPESKHNSTPSKALDAIPYYKEASKRTKTENMYLFVGIVKGIAISKGIKIRGGDDWDGDNDTQDQEFHDPGHFEVE